MTVKKINQYLLTKQYQHLYSEAADPMLVLDKTGQNIYNPGKRCHQQNITMYLTSHRYDREIGGSLGKQIDV